MSTLHSRRHPRVSVVGALVLLLVATLITAAGPHAGASAPRATVTTTTVAATPQLITVGPSRRECLEPFIAKPGFAALNAVVNSFETLTDSTVDCLSAYLNSSTGWYGWVHPWVADKYYGYLTWVKADPLHRQLVLGVNLIPRYLEDLHNPLSWETRCAGGAYNSYAAQLGRSLVHEGLGHSVLRLGPEMNGLWEYDYVGDTLQDQRMWARCFDQEVSALRAVNGEHFLIDWNPNACVGNIPFSNFYPGNAYVDILGVDLFDESCISPPTHYSFQQLANEPDSLVPLERFASKTHKPISLPEWALSRAPLTDDPGYVNGVGQAFFTRDFAFESYFDFQTPQPLLSPSSPRALEAFQHWFSRNRTSG